MSIPRIIPVLLLKGRGLYKTRKFKDDKYVGDPINIVRIFNEKAVDELVVLDIDATPTGVGPRIDIIKQLASECFMPLSYGGGVRTLEEMDMLYTAGVEKVVLDSVVYENYELVRHAAERWGSQSVVVCMDVKKSLVGSYALYSDHGRKKQSIGVLEHVKNVEAAGCGEIIVNSISNDGMQDGYDLKLVRSIAESVDIPVVACGGAGRLEDFRAVVLAGASAAAGGSFFVFHGKHRAVLVTYPERARIVDLFTDIADLEEWHD